MARLGDHLRKRNEQREQQISQELTRAFEHFPGGNPLDRIDTDGNDAPIFRYETWAASQEKIAELRALHQQIADAPTPEQAREIAQQLLDRAKKSRRRSTKE